MTILKVAVPTPVRTLFDYLSPAECDLKLLQPGIRLLVPFRNREIVGVLLGVASKSKLAPSKLKAAHKIIDEKPLLTPTLLELVSWASDYYHHPIGEVLESVLPKQLRAGKTPLIDEKLLANNYSGQQQLIELNKAQQEAVTTIKGEQKFKVFLLNGVTSSGKTEVYLRVIAEVMAAGRQALVLVPEIGLTPQTVTRFQKRFPVKIAVLHSRLTDKERAQAWLAAKDGKAPIVIGTRSSIFTPLIKPGIIILDEEHDQSFKQQAGFRYSARDLAVMRGKIEDIPVILGSATPSLESIHNSSKGCYQLLELPERAGEATHPTFHVLDICNQRLRAGMASQLLHEIREQISNNNQVLLFLNRRGYAPTLLCHSCGWVAGCRNCDAKLTLHQEPHYLHCHHCGATRPIYRNCPQCGSDKMISIGAGTERLEEKLVEEFPDATLLRVDRDTTMRKGAMEKMLSEVRDNNYQILLGTQMLAKGHHFPNVTIAAILDADQGLLSADFRASEHIAQLIMQVAGRAGRAEKLGKVFIQTHTPKHPRLLSLIKYGYNRVAAELLQERAQAGLPPLSHFALIRCEARQQTDALTFLEELKQRSGRFGTQQVTILGPIPALMERKAGMYRAQLLLTSGNRAALHGVLTPLAKELENLRNHKIRCSLDVDPADMF